MVRAKGKEEREEGAGSKETRIQGTGFRVKKNREQGTG